MATARQRIGIRRIKTTIPALQTVVVDTNDFDSFRSVTYSITVTNLSNTTTQTLKLVATKINNDVEDQIYSKFLGTLKINLNFSKLGSEALLTVENKESFDLIAFINKELN